MMGASGAWDLGGQEKLHCGAAKGQDPALTMLQGARCAHFALSAGPVTCRDAPRAELEVDGSPAAGASGGKAHTATKPPLTLHA